MRTLWDDEVTRRSLLKLGVTAAALLATPWPARRPAAAANGTPHFLVTFFADGGWDPTQTLDPHDPLDSTDGVDVDVPGQPVSQFRTVSGLTYMSNPVTRPAVDAFFDTWAARSAIINGINTRSTSHDQSRQLVLTGYLDPTRADFPVMAAHHNGSDMPLPHLLISGTSFGGPFAGLSGRVGGQLSTALAYNRIPGQPDPTVSQFGVSALGEAYVQQALERERMVDADGLVGGRLAQFRDASQRGDKLVRLAASLPRNFNNGTQLATSLAAAFRAGMTTSVSLSVQGGFDTHGDNTEQNLRWDNLFTFLNAFVAGLAAEPGLVSGSMLDETTVVYCSEFGRTPQLNGTNGKDHHPWTSMLLVGKRVRPAVTVGLTDRDQEGVEVNYSTGQPDDAGQVIDVQNVVAGILTLVGANAETYLPNVKPFTAMIDA
jgi:uncharacterized protein (DUF1501 family)